MRTALKLKAKLAKPVAAASMLAGLLLAEAAWAQEEATQTGAIPADGSHADAAPAAEAHAEAAHAAAAHADPWMDLAYSAINMAILVSILLYFFGKPIRDFVRGMAVRVKEAMDETRRLEQEASKALEIEKKNIASLDGELAHLMAEVKAETSKERDRLTAEAKAMAEKLKAQAKEQIDMERQKAVESLRSELAEATISLAEKAIKEKIDKKGQQKLVKEHIDNLEATR